MWTNDPPSLALVTPGWIWIVCVPGVGQRQENKTVSGMLRAELDLFCQIPVVSVVSVPSMNTRACPASQHCSPTVPYRAMASSVKVIEYGSIDVVMSSVVVVAPLHAVVVLGVPVGSRLPAATISAYPPIVMNIVTVPVGGGPSKKRPYAPLDVWAEAAAFALFSSQVFAKACFAPESTARYHIPSMSGSTMSFSACRLV